MKVLASLSIAARLSLLSVISAIGFCGVIALDLDEQWRELNQARQMELRNLVDTAVAVIADFSDQAGKGKLSLDEAKARAKARIAAMRYRGGGYFWINDYHSKMVMHPIKPQLDGQDLSGFKDPDGMAIFVEFVKKVKASGEGFVGYYWAKPGAEKPVAKLSYVRGFEPWGWIVGTGVYMDDLVAQFWTNALWLLAKVAVVFLVIIGLTIFLIHSITKPLAAIRTAMQHLAGSRYDVEIPGRDRRDEIGAMAEMLEVFRNNGLERVALEKAQAEERARKEARQRTVDSLIQTFQRDTGQALESVSSNTEQLQATAATLTSIATGTSEKATSVAAASEQTSVNVTAVAAASEELAQSINEIAQQLAKASNSISSASDMATDTSSHMVTLANSTQKINDVVTLIQEIASQTNLLALNATIEASRAGDAGRGFAVVASEVKNLAQQTAKATEVISQQIAEVQAATREAVTSMDQITKMMAGVSSATVSVAAAIDEQRAATSEISGNVSYAADGTKHVSKDILDVQSAADGTLRAAKEMLNASSDAGEKTGVLQRKISRFLHDVAAA
jgi:methyl-accepting chemotaxis protein